MTLNEYQLRAITFATLPTDTRIDYLSLALCGEVGEVANKVKKVMRDRQGKFFADDVEDIGSELGDVLWYLSVLTKRLGLTLSDIAQQNLDKIQSRYDRGVISGSGDNR